MLRLEKKRSWQNHANSRRPQNDFLKTLGGTGRGEKAVKITLLQVGGNTPSTKLLPSKMPGRGSGD